MLPIDKGTRNLLPFLQDDPEEIFSAEADVGSPLLSKEAPAAVPAAAGRPVADLPPADDHEDHDAPRIVPINAPASSGSAFHLASLGGAEATGFPVTAGTWAQTFSVPKPLGVFKPARPIHDGHDDTDDPENGDRASDPEDERDGINVTQIAEADQDAAVIVHGYAGKVVARLHIDQDLVMHQDVSIVLVTDGDGYLAFSLDQYTRVDQEIDIDLKIFDVDNVLYVDLFLHDSIEIEQDMRLDAHIGDGIPGGTMEVVQDLEMNQDVDIDIDIEDELEERFIVKVDVDVVQDADVDQMADVDVGYRNGEVDLDVDSVQTALVDQETIVRIDFAVA